MAVKDEGRGEVGRSEQTAQLSRRGESEGREKQGARDQGRKKYIYKVSIEGFLKRQNNSQMSFFQI